MFKFYWRFSEYFQLKNIEYNFVRQFHNSSILNVKSLFKLNDYLLNRMIPASEILNSLLPEDSDRLDQIKRNIDFKLASGDLVPKKISDEAYLELLCLSFGQQNKYIEFLAKKEYKEENDFIRKSNKIPIQEILYPIDSPIKITNRFVSKYHNVIEKRLVTNRMYEALILKSQELIFDFSFENEMTRREVGELSRQLALCYSINRSLKEPFQMVFVNLEFGSLTYCDLRRSLSKDNLGKSIEDMPFVIHPTSYIKAFPGRKLIYLTPDSNRNFSNGEFDHDAIYIMGGIVDRGSQLPLTLAKARRENIETRCIPIDRYVKWQKGNRGLPLNHVFNIMSIARDTNGDWRKAICESIATRFVTPCRPRSPLLDID